MVLRAISLAALCLILSGAASGQPLSVLHIKVTLVDADGHVTPIPRHALLISDEPPTAVPRRYVTKTDGTADVSLRPGAYTVESDQPVAFHGQSYNWTQIVQVAAGRDTELELNAENAEAGPLTGDTAPLSTPDTDPRVLLQPWRDSLVTVWSPTARASGFVVDRSGLIATTRAAVGGATSVEVQIAPAVKVVGRVFAPEAARDVAIVRIDPATIAGVAPVPLGCDGAVRPPLTEGQQIFTIDAPLRTARDVLPGEVRRVDLQGIQSDFALAQGSDGGPVFAPDGAFVGITAPSGDEDRGRREQFRVVPAAIACDALASARGLAAGTPPAGTRLPVEPPRGFPIDALKDAAKRRTASVSPYVVSSSDFDVQFITPILVYSAQQIEEGRGGASSGRGRNAVQASANSALTDFDGWSDYVADVPPVLLIRVTPRMVEGFWTTVARGAAMTQGIAVPSIKHFKSGFANMRAYCGEQEVTPIHPFALEHRISDTETVDEGLYAFDPGALGPQCASVTLVLFSEKQPDKGDSRTIDPKVIQQVWDDFAAFRAQD